MNALLSTIDIKLATLLYSGIKTLSADYEDGVFWTGARKLNALLIGSAKATLIDGNIMGSCWNLRELHGYKNRYNNARIYKKGKIVRTTDKYALADAVNFESVTIEEDVVEWEPMTSFLEANLVCGCEVTVLEDGTEYVTRCTSKACHRRVLPY